jgi:methyl-accepting chemotaxis protein WspA
VSLTLRSPAAFLEEKLRDLPLSRKLNFVLLAGLGLAVLLVGGGIYFFERTTSTAEMARTLGTLAEVVGANAKASISFDDAVMAEKILETLAADSDVVLVCLYGSRGELFASWSRPGVGSFRPPTLVDGKAPLPGSGRLQVLRDIPGENGKAGTILVQAMTNRLRERRIRFLGIVAVAAATALAVAWAATGLLVRNLVRALAVPMDVLRRVSGGDLTVEVPTPARDEIGELLGVARSMIQNLGSLIGRLQNTCAQIGASTSRITSSGHDLEATANEQLASTNEVAATAREISETTSDLTGAMNEAALFSSETAFAAVEGRKGLERMEEVMQWFEKATSSISVRLQAINQKTSEINSVVATISKVADQTNLLSLNAAIEAERAGEAGLGFGVVAREIRVLADQTASATLDIMKVVEEMRTAVASGVKGMEKFSDEASRAVDQVRNVGNQFARIIERIQELSPRLEAVRTGMEAQSLGAAQIRDAMAMLGESAARVAESLRSTNQAVDDLEESSRALESEISAFQVS